MITFRPGAFETNSSSTHALGYCTVDEFNRFIAGELAFDIGEEKLVPISKEFIRAQFTHRDFERINASNRWQEEATAELKTLSDGTRFGVVKYDNEEVSL